MKYVMSDIHGCKEEYLALLEKIQFSERDHLYILGDVVDRGPEPIETLQDIMKRDNVTFLLGNHDFMFYYFVGKGGYEFIDFKKDDIWYFRSWIKDGGLPTMDGFLALPDEEKRTVYDYIKKAITYRIIEDGNKTYILSHAGIDNFDEKKPLDLYDHMDFIEGRIDYRRRYFSDENTYIISGHTPTPMIREDRCAEIYEGNGHIAIDCACVFGGRLAAYCIETGKVEYVANRRKQRQF